MPQWRNIEDFSPHPDPLRDKTPVQNKTIDNLIISNCLKIFCS